MSLVFYNQYDECHYIGFFQLCGDRITFEVDLWNLMIC